VIRDKREEGQTLGESKKKGQEEEFPDSRIDYPLRKHPSERGKQGKGTQDARS